MINITSEQQFKDVIESLNQISVIYVGRDGCGGCVKFHPLMHDYVTAHANLVYPIPVAYYYLDTRQDFIRPYIGGKNLPPTGVPSLVFYHGAKVSAIHTGYLELEDLKQLCNKYIQDIINSQTSIDTQ